MLQFEFTSKPFLIKFGFFLTVTFNIRSPGGPPSSEQFPFSETFRLIPVSTPLGKLTF